MASWPAPYELAHNLPQLLVPLVDVLDPELDEDGVIVGRASDADSKQLDGTETGYRG